MRISETFQAHPVFLPDAVVTMRGAYRADIDNSGYHDLLNAPNAPVAYSFLSAASSIYLTSTDNSDTQTIRVEYLDEDYLPVVADVALTGNTPALVGTAIRVNLIYNVESTATAGDVWVSRNTSSTLGIPNSTADMLAYFSQASQKSQMAIYTVPAGYVAYITSAAVSVLFSDKMRIHGEARQFGGVFLNHFPLDRTAGGGDSITFPVPLLFPEKTDFRVVAKQEGSQAGDVSFWYQFGLMKVE